MHFFLKKIHIHIYFRHKKFLTCKIVAVTHLYLYPTGVKLKVLTHKKLQNVKEVYDIDIVDDQLVLACGVDGLACFELTFEAVVL